MSSAVLNDAADAEGLKQGEEVTGGRAGNRGSRAEAELRATKATLSELPAERQAGEC